jgi:hypothetical protein
VCRTKSYPLSIVFHQKFHVGCGTLSTLSLRNFAPQFRPTFDRTRCPTSTLNALLLLPVSSVASARVKVLPPQIGTLIRLKRRKNVEAARLRHNSFDLHLLSGRSHTGPPNRRNAVLIAQFLELLRPISKHSLASEPKTLTFLWSLPVNGNGTEYRGLEMCGPAFRWLTARYEDQEAFEKIHLSSEPVAALLKYIPYVDMDD